MNPSLVLRALPYVLLVGGIGAYSLVFAALVRRADLARRPLLIVGVLLGGLPALYAGLTGCGLMSQGYLRLTRPSLTLVGAAAALFVAWRLAKSPVRQGPWRRRFTDVAVMLAAFAAALAATGPEIGKPLDRLTVLVAIDRSRSIDLVPNAERRIAQELSIAEVGMRDEDRIGAIAFGAEAMTEDPPRPKSDLPAPQRASIGRDGTDLAAAIRRALAEVPPDSAARIVLLTDGVATRGDTFSAASAALAAQIPVDVVPLEQRPLRDVRVVALRAPPRADEGETFELRLVTAAPSPAEIEIRIRRDGDLLQRATAQIASGEDVVRIRQKAPGPGLHRYDVEISAADRTLDEAPDDNAGSVFLRVRGQTTALVLDGDAGKTAFVAKALESASFRVDQGSTTSVPSDVGGFAAYDIVFLGDIRASDLSTAQIDAVASYVRDFGGGLVLTGGDRSMGPGGYAKTPVEEIAPVSFDLKQEKRRASLAEVIGIDISGSMGASVRGHTKLELANEAAARSAALLGPGDRLGVEHVDTAVKWSVPLGPVTEKQAIDRAIRSVGVGGGGIYVDVTLEAGYAALDRERVNLKHMLLFADGSDAERMAGCRPVVADALRRGITTSVVALGMGDDVPELEQLSKLGGGRFYVVEDATRLPAIFTEETILASRSAIVEKDFRVAPGAPSGATGGIAFDEAPALKGYVVTIPKGRASVLLTGPENDPILAVWSAGIGRSAAFTSDLKDRWGAAWTQWPGAARLVAQLARDVARKADDGRVRLEADAVGGELHVRATVVGDDGRAQSFRRLAVHVAGPDGMTRDVPLEAAGAGAYAATVPLARPGTYIAVARDELTGEAVGTAGTVLSAGEELRPTGTDFALLARIAEFTGGRRRDTLAGIFGDRGATRFAYTDATPMLVVMAALVLLFMVAARRLAIPQRWVQWAAATRARRANRARGQEHPAAVVETAAPEPLVGQLLARQRARAAAPQPSTEPKPAAPMPPRPSPATAPSNAWLPSTSAPSAPRAASPTVPAASASGPAIVSDTAGHSDADRAPAQPTASGPDRPLTAAEILLARRKRSRGP